MIPTFSRQSAATAYDEADEEFEPHVSGAGSFRVLEFIRHCNRFGAAGNANGVGSVANENPVDRAQVASRHILEASTRLIEATSTGAGRALAARNLNDLVEAQYALFQSYLNWLSFTFREVRP